MSAIKPERLLTVDEAAAAVNFTPATVLRWIAEGLPHVPGAKNGRVGRRGRKDIRVRESALWEWVRGLEMVRVPKAAAEGVGPKGKGRPADPRGLSAWREGKGATR